MTEAKTRTYLVQVYEHHTWFMRIVAGSLSDANAKAEAFFVKYRKPAPRYNGEGIAADLVATGVRFGRVAPRKPWSKDQATRDDDRDAANDAA